MWTHFPNFEVWWKHRPQKPGFPGRKLWFSVFSCSERKCLNVLFLHGEVSVASGLTRIDYSCPDVFDSSRSPLAFLCYCCRWITSIKNMSDGHVNEVENTTFERTDPRWCFVHAPPHPPPPHTHPRAVYLLSSVRSVPLCVFEKAPEGHSNLQTFKV